VRSTAPAPLTALVLRHYPRVARGGQRGRWAANMNKDSKELNSFQGGLTVSGLLAGFAFTAVLELSYRTEPTLVDTLMLFAFVRVPSSFSTSTVMTCSIRWTSMPATTLCKGDKPSIKTFFH